jgi:hypothetical protein
VLANPNDRYVLNDLAWMQATCPDDDFRNAKKSFDNASKAHQLDGGKSSVSYKTLSDSRTETCKEACRSVVQVWNDVGVGVWEWEE